MASLENLIDKIYHEKQQPGSMLCAQHALNSLLQGNYFSAPDLSDIARNLDSLERRYVENNGSTGGSSNMDDTGFFSVQVLENALNVLGLNLMRWRGQEMRPYQDQPHTQLAFILNLNQHWFTLRRFGHAEPRLELDSGNGHWFNLDSALKAPEWVGKTYLGMVLQQAETDGYSVFVVTQANPLAPLALTRTESDEIASNLPEPTSAPRPSSSTTRPDVSSSAQIPGFEEEDYELQIALQASLADGSFSPFDSGDPSSAPIGRPPPLARARYTALPPASNPDSGIQTPTSLQDLSQSSQSLRSSALLSTTDDDGDDDDENSTLDPLAVSLERNRIMLQRMQEEQEYAQRELMASRTFQDIDSEAGGRSANRTRSEDEDLQRAIEESAEAARRQDRSVTGTIQTNGPTSMSLLEEFSSPGQFPDSRVYDDDDQELQAALKASLECMPEGWQPVPFLNQTVPPEPSTSSPTTNEMSRERDDAESVLSEGDNATQSEIPAIPVDLNELRRKRLAKFRSPTD